MKRSLITSLLLVLFTIALNAQKSEPVTKGEIKDIVHKIADSLEFYYVNYERGKEIGAHLKKAERNSIFASGITPDSLAELLTNELRSFSGDLHLSVLHRPEGMPAKNQPNKIERNEKIQSSNYGIPEVTIQEGNIGYINIASFSNWDYYEETKQVMTAAMKMVENADAIIFDVRGNQGGVPNLVAYLCTYLFEGERVHLAQYHHRYQNSGYGLYTEVEVPGKRLPEVPVFVLVNKKSASAAEEFAFFLKYLDRATIIGEPTIGAGYGAMLHRLNDRFVVSISSEEDISPLTNAKIQQSGVIPDVTTEADETMPMALRLAEKAATKFRQEKTKKQQALLEALENINARSNEMDVIRILRDSKREELINVNDINRIGYVYLESAPSLAEAIFKLNVGLYPDNSNVYDSYGDALIANGKFNEAVENYAKAVALATSENSRNVSLYRDNLVKAQAMTQDADPEITAITRTLNDYIEGTAQGNSKRIDNAFYKDLNLYTITNDSLAITPGKKYISYFENGQKRNRIGKIISIDYENDAAIAKIEVEMPDRAMTYTDYLLLLKIEGAWKIIHKSYTKKVK